MDILEQYIEVLEGRHVTYIEVIDKLIKRIEDLEIRIDELEKRIES